MQHYSPKDYNARPDNQALVQGDNGLMYIGNSKGVLEFDGISWRLIQLPNQGIIKTLEKNSNGTIFVGGFNELGYLRPDSLGFMTFQSLKPNLDRINKDFTYLRYSFTIEDDAYFLSDHHLMRWSEGKFKVWDSESSFTYATAIGKTIYVQEKKKGLCILKDDNLQPVAPFDYQIREILAYYKDKILIATEKDGFFIYNNGTYSPFRTSIDAFLKKHMIYKCKKLPNGWISICTYSGGLVVLDDKGALVQILDKSKGLLDNFVINQVLDNQGGLWLGLNTGISRIEILSPYSIFDERLGISGFVNHITRYNGELFAASTNGASRLMRDEINDKNFFELISGPDRSWYLLEVDEGLLIGSRNGLFQFKENQIEQLGQGQTSALCRSKRDPSILYVGLTDGFSVMKNHNRIWYSLGRVEGINDDIREIVELDDGKLWLESQVDGVWSVDFYRGDTFNINNPEIEDYKANKELPPGWLFLHSINGKAVFEIEGKIYKYDEEQDSVVQDKLFGVPFGFKGDIVPKIQDKYGNLWMSAQLLGQKDEEKQRTVSIPQIDGSYIVKQINDKRITHQAKKALFPDELNVLWYGGVDGIIRQDLNLGTPIISHFKALIRKISLNQDSLVFGGTKTSNQISTWGYDNDLVRFEYAAPSYNEVSQNRYQFYLEGYDTKWSDWTEETKKDYTKVPEGDYVFRVKAKNIYQQLSQEDIYEFTILPPWYRTWWAYLIYLILFLGFLMAILKLRSRQLKAQNEALEKLIAVRTSEVQHQANQLRIQSEQLQELDKAKSRFFANISHEFRTPLTLIKGPIEQLEQNFTERLNMDTIKMIRRNANRLLNMVNQLLDLSKIDEGNLKIAPTEGDVFKCLRTAASSFNSHAAQRNMDYRVEIPSTVLWASFDRDKLENIIYNLLGNAFKFSRDESKITFFAEYTEYGLQIKVSDAGKGIPEEKLPFIFDRFYQADSSITRDSGGSGIGLSFSKNLVELMGGTITVMSEVEKGTQFIIHLPVQEIITGQNKTIESTPSGKKIPVQTLFTFTPKDQRNLPTILLVEDNNDMSHFIKEQLVRFYKVEEAFDGTTGLKKAVLNPPDLIITDLMMPRMDGIELCKELKTDIHTSHIPVIMLTAKAGMNNKLEGLETGADDYLTKPFNSRELLVRTRNLIQQRQNLRELFSNKEVSIDPKKVTVNSIDEKFLEQVLALLEANYPDSDFGVPQMQDSLAMSKTQLHRKLKALTNEAPGELLRNFRLKRAAQLLSQKADSVTQIAYRVGFNNLSYFAKCFKELYGVAPSTY